MSEREPSRSALYTGTEVGSKWWKRYRAPGFFARGNGAYWFEDGEQLSSGFGFGDRASADAFVARIRELRPGASG